MKRANIPHKILTRLINCLVICFCIVPTILKAQELNSTSLYRTEADVIKDTGRLMKAIIAAKPLRYQYPDSAKRIYHRLLMESRELGFPDGVASVHMDIGMIHYNAGDIDSAINIFQQGMPYARVAIGRRMQLITGLYSNIAAMYMVKGESQKAVQCYDSALQAALHYGMAKDHAYFANIYINLGILYAQIKNYTTANFYINQAISLSSEKGYQEELMNAYFNKATISLQTERLADAKIYYQKAEELAKGIGHTDLCRSVYEEMINLLTLEKDSAGVEIYRNKLLNMDSSSQSTFLHKWIHYLNKGIRHLKSHKYKEAERDFLLAETYIGEEYVLQKKIQLSTYLAELYEQTNRYPQALKQLKAIIRQKDSLQQINNLKVIHELDIKYQTEEKNKQIIQQTNAVRIRNIWITASVITISLLLLLLLILLRHYQQNQKIYRQQEEITGLKAMIKGEEKERVRLARDLHDGIGGMMAVISMGLSNFKEQVATGKPYQKLENLVAETSDEIRRTAHNLIPSVLERESLSEALRHYCAGLSVKEELTIETYFNGPIDELEQGPALLVYRIIQELLQNVAKHASASLAELQITLQDDLLSITVEDNGKGFVPDAVQPGMGLDNLRHRVNALHGYLSINSVPGKNTTIYIELKLEKLKLIV